MLLKTWRAQMPGSVKTIDTVNTFDGLWEARCAGVSATGASPEEARLSLSAELVRHHGCSAIYRPEQPSMDDMMAITNAAVDTNIAVIVNVSGVSSEEMADLILGRPHVRASLAILGYGTREKIIQYVDRIRSLEFGDVVPPLN